MFHSSRTIEHFFENIQGPFLFLSILVPLTFFYTALLVVSSEGIVLLCSAEDSGTVGATVLHEAKNRRQKMLDYN